MIFVFLKNRLYHVLKYILLESKNLPEQQSYYQNNYVGISSMMSNAAKNYFDILTI